MLKRAKQAKLSYGNRTGRYGRIPKRKVYLLQGTHFRNIEIVNRSLLEELVE